MTGSPPPPVPIRVGDPLTLDDVGAVADGAPVEIAPEAVARIVAARRLVEQTVESGATVYGVTTGFGSLANIRIEPDRAAQLQERIVRSHATAVGQLLSRAETRAMLLLRAHVLALGHSGVRPLVVERMIEMLNIGLVPAVPEQGSLGASGDLAPLATLALPLLGSGEVLDEDDRPRAAAPALEAAGLEPLELKAKEGLALVNGTQGMLAVGILAARRLSHLARVADVVAAMTIDGALGTDTPFDARLQRLRPHAGQSASAANLRALLAGSQILSSHADSPHLVQDAYSLRCAPQVHGAARDALTYANGVLAIETNAVSDNPIVLVPEREILSGGNFHGQPVAIALDTLATATVPLASMAERRIYRLLDPARNNGLPAFLVPDGGMNSGLMLAQYTAASLVSESKSLAHPASIDSITSSAGQEDHVSMGMIAARHARSCVGFAETVVGIELLAASQAIDLRAPLAPGPGVRAAHAVVREVVEFLDVDRELRPDIDACVELVRGDRLVRAAEAAVGALA